MGSNYHIHTMDIKFLKEELQRLNLIIDSWNESDEIATLEQDIALETLRSIYNQIRFSQPHTTATQEKAESTTIPTPVIPTPTASESEDEEPEKEQEIEVEFIFNEEEDDEDGEDGLTIEPEEQPAEQEEQTEQPAEQEESEDYAAEQTAEDNFFDDTPEVEAETDNKTEEDNKVEAAAEVAPTQSIEPLAEPTQENKPTAETATASTPAEPTVMIGNLFGDAEPPRKSPRTKHQRMMSIYSEPEEETRAEVEQSVDISKIFEIDDVNFAEDTTDNDIIIRVDEEEEFIVEEPATRPTISEERTTILADVITPAAPTIADSIAPPTALADEIEHSSIRSLSDGIGINDKFLMVRDLFGGNTAEYEKVISTLDAMESFDDCMIYIVENFAWNPDSDGAKFIMKLLERKLA